MLSFRNASQNLEKKTMSSQVSASKNVFAMCFFQPGRNGLEVISLKSSRAVSLRLKVHKRENFLGFDFEICTFS
jgi:hypothetical protein